MQLRKGKRIIISNILYVPGMTPNMLSVGKLTDSGLLASRVSFCTRHMPNDSQSQSTFATSQSKDMLKYDQPVKQPMM